MTLWHLCTKVKKWTTRCVALCTWEEGGQVSFKTFIANLVTLLWLSLVSSTHSGLSVSLPSISSLQHCRKICTTYLHRILLSPTQEIKIYLQVILNKTIRKISTKSAKQYYGNKSNRKELHRLLVCVPTWGITQEEEENENVFITERRKQKLRGDTLFLSFQNVNSGTQSTNALVVVVVSLYNCLEEENKSLNCKCVIEKSHKTHTHAHRTD